LPTPLLTGDFIPMREISSSFSDQSRLPPEKEGRAKENAPSPFFFSLDTSFFLLHNFFLSSLAPVLFPPRTIPPSFDGSVLFFFFFFFRGSSCSETFLYLAVCFLFSSLMVTQWGMSDKAFLFFFYPWAFPFLFFPLFFPPAIIDEEISAIISRLLPPFSFSSPMFPSRKVFSFFPRKR